jgi:hypothetical protein
MEPLHPSRKTCPSCGSHQLSRSHRRGIIERYVLRALEIRPFRCTACDARFYGRDASEQQVSPEVSESHQV